MNRTLKLKDLTLGKTDAKNELIGNTPEEQEMFQNSFLMPDNVKVEDFINYRKYFILGFKGIGKTALLRYLELTIRRTNSSAATSILLFKSDIDEDEMENIGTASYGFAVDRESAPNYEESKFTNVWKWFLLRQIAWIADSEQKKGKPVFEKDRNWDKFKNCVSALDPEDSKWWKTFNPKVKRGNVNLRCDIKGLTAGINLELEWDRTKRTIKFSDLVKLAENLFYNLTSTNKDVFLFIDELEVSYSTSKKYKRDIQLLKDLILSIYWLNTKCREYKFPIRIISAVRSEVRTAIGATGGEINKPLIDFGVTLKWQQSGGKAETHPLIKLINRRINSSEQSLGLSQSSAQEIWEKYFPEIINNQRATEYILRKTWYRPRDIIRMFNIAQDQYPEETMFTQQVFDAINKDYSSQSWEEMAEELSANYTPNEIDGIKKMLRGVPYAFTLTELDERNTKIRELYTNVDKLLSQHKLADILEQLYNIGIIGNTGENVRYSFRGDDGLILTNKIKIHDPLWNYFAVERRQE